MLIFVRVSLAVAAAVSLGFAWTVGQTGLKQVNRNLCELWESLPLPHYERCEFQYTLVALWLIVAAAIVLWVGIEIYLRRKAIKGFALPACSAIKSAAVHIAGKVAWVAKQLEPWHVIVVGLLIAIGGLVWQQLRPAPPSASRASSAAVSTLQGELVTTRRELEDLKRSRAPSPSAIFTPAQSGPPPLPPAADQVKALKEELRAAEESRKSALQSVKTDSERVDAALYEMFDAITKEAIPNYAEAGYLVDNWHMKLTSVDGRRGVLG
jgi:hypothetical protein